MLPARLRPPPFTATFSLRTIARHVSRNLFLKNSFCLGEGVGLQQEPFISGVPEMIDDLVRDFPNARAGFRLLLFSAHVVREEMGSNWDQLESPLLEGWLFPALFKYFEQAPQELFVCAEERKAVLQLVSRDYSGPQPSQHERQYFSQPEKYAQGCSQ